MKLEEKIVVVTGASSGMGEAITKLFVSEGATVIAVARRANRLEELEKACSGLSGKVIAHPGDVSLKETNEAMIDYAINNFGKIDILVNNAGIMDEFMPIGEISDEMWEKVQRVNVFGPMYAMRKAVQEMTKQEHGGVIVNVASIGGLYGARAGVAYTASKHALVGMTKNTAYMYGGKIRCNAICPGGVDTEVGINFKQPSKLGMERTMTGAGVNLRMGKANEVAKVALFLASDDSSLINGTTVTADAGATAY